MRNTDVPMCQRCEKRRRRSREEKGEKPVKNANKRRGNETQNTTTHAPANKQTTTFVQTATRTHTRTTTYQKMHEQPHTHAHTHDHLPTNTSSHIRTQTNKKRPPTCKRKQTHANTHRIQNSPGLKIVHTASKQSLPVVNIHIDDYRHVQICAWHLHAKSHTQRYTCVWSTYECE